MCVFPRITTLHINHLRWSMKIYRLKPQKTLRIQFFHSDACSRSTTRAAEIEYEQRNTESDGLDGTTGVSDQEPGRSDVRRDRADHRKLHGERNYSFLPPRPDRAVSQRGYPPAFGRELQVRRNAAHWPRRARRKVRPRRIPIISMHLTATDHTMRRAEANTNLMDEATVNDQ